MPQMTWNWTKDTPVPRDEQVVGLMLHEFVNADWRWSQPYIYYVGCTYECPTVWAPVEPPTVPGFLPF